MAGPRKDKLIEMAANVETTKWLYELETIPVNISEIRSVLNAALQAVERLPKRKLKEGWAAARVEILELQKLVEFAPPRFKNEKDEMDVRLKDLGSSMKRLTDDY